MTKRFLIEKSNVNFISFHNGNDLKVDFKLQPELFDRVYIEAFVDKKSGMEIKQFELVVYNGKNKIINPVFKPLAWDSLHSSTIQMDSFFEINDYSTKNRFGLSGQYSIEHTDSLKMHIDCIYSIGGKVISIYKQFGVKIEDCLALEKLIQY